MMLKKEARVITGGLSAPSKMPGPAYNLPAADCITGAKLVKVPGSVCAGCYALKGRYRFNNVQSALRRRAASLMHPDWIDAMVALISGHEYFRWHDSGDIQSVEHLKRIFEVCKRTPDTKHWMPTREARFLRLMDPDIIPSNLIIRMSSHMIDQGPVTFWPWTSTVSSVTKTCPAQDQGNKCQSCRACWDRKVANVTYPKH
jgi:hypothetical protein